ncbi:MAG: low temperature requirement protein A [Candidatus Andeanibacterium colombiense]|uniref:Low temperature requirement protein A n=1 Tax=Candidatus Andeanibacterium colombiense TaxID=3121345 RepID=A0AAJ5X8H1_9SPHN|nr:MAG: low temperature requirement protein A [Sphingomonadaceae bacterium]
MPAERRTLLRDLSHGHAAVSYLELFLDLVYVFAITQMSHFLIEHLSPLGALQALILFLAVWWAWIYTTWATNWLDPERGPVRFIIGGVMIGSLLMSSSLPYAFEQGGIVFALAYSGIQVLRTAFTAWAMRRDDKVNSHNLARATVYFLLAGALWIAGALDPQPLPRMALWVIALGIEFSGPASGFWVPWVGRAKTGDWQISGAHMAERCALFIIIALGEGIIVTGSQFAKVEPDRAILLALFTAFTGSFALWWVYFDLGARIGAENIEHHADPGKIARDAFTYWHIPIVAGIVVLAVVDEQTLAHPLATAHLDFVLTLLGGSLLFLGGTMVFKRISNGNPWFPSSHVYGLWGTGGVALWGWLAHPSHLALANIQTLVFVGVAVWEWRSFHGGWIDTIERYGGPAGRLLKRRADHIRDSRLAKQEKD